MNLMRQPITISTVADGQRLDFLSTNFGQYLMILGEELVYDWLRRHCDQYKRSYWNYYQLSNGGFYMAPDLAGRLRIEIPGNWYKRELSSDAAGIVATLYTLNQLADELVGTGVSETLIDRYHLLRNFALYKHAEANLIYDAID